ncbi:lipid-A-disaccharide synthase [Candidatus Symbiobacter mobilis]|nr:lipid-A-disaccharide synthase [Candidatus Symbiobacter mobilis]
MTAIPGTLRAALVAGEDSGDILGAALLEGLRHRWPTVQAAGIGGPRMAAQGFDAWWPHHRLSVHGFGWDTLRRIPGILSIRQRLAHRLFDAPPQVFVGIDAPDFNLHLEERLRQRGIRTVHYVCPSVWAWRAERLPRLQRYADLMLCVFPFEPAWLAERGIRASFVGHPLAAAIPATPDRAGARLRLGLPPESTVLAVLPGSRESEIRHLAPRFLACARIVQQAWGPVHVILPAVPQLEPQIRRIASQEPPVPHLTIVSGQSHAVLAACDVALVASGTATLEAALFQCPMVIAYAMSPLSWRIMQGKRLQPWVGLPNILSGEFVVPELLQEQATPQALAKAVLAWLDAHACSPDQITRLRQGFRALHATLLQDTPTLASQAIAEMLGA